jgi:uncharacterized coiled-coil DUF342 family protein
MSRNGQTGKKKRLEIIQILNKLFKEYLKLLNRLYYITWFGAVYD